MVARSDLRACFIGDSYVAGVGDDAGLGWVGRVSAAARAAGADLTVYNLGVRGQTGPQLVERAARELKPRLAAGDVHALVVAFGANDISRNLPAATSVRAAGRLLDLALRIEATPLLLSPPVFQRDPAKDLSARRLSDSIAALCASRGVAFLNLRETQIDWRIWWDEAQAGDGAHPNAGGYEQLAAVFVGWSAWRGWLGL